MPTKGYRSHRRLGKSNNDSMTGRLGINFADYVEGAAL